MSEDDLKVGDVVSDPGLATRIAKAGKPVKPSDGEKQNFSEDAYLKGRIDENNRVTDPDLIKKLESQNKAYNQKWGGVSQADKDRAKETVGGDGDGGTATTFLQNVANIGAAHLGEPLQAFLDKNWFGKSAVNGKTFDTYDQYLQNVKAIDAARNQQHPTAATAGDVAGVGLMAGQAIATGGGSLAGRGALGASAEAAPAVVDAVAPSLGRQMLTGAGQNAAIGAAYGGVDQAAQGNYNQIIPAALTGAALGGALGAGAPLVAAGAGKVSDAVKRGLASRGDLEAITPVGERASNVVDNLANLEAKSQAGVDAAYQKVRDAGGAFDRGAFDDLGVKFKNALDQANVRPRLADDAYGVADDIASKLKGNAHTLDTIDGERQYINRAIDNAVRNPQGGEDARGLIAIKKALDDHVDGLANRLQGADGAGVIQDMKDARKLASDHFSFFDSNDEGGRVIKKLLNTDRSLSQQEKANLLFGTDALSPSSMADAGFAAQKIKEKFGNTPQGQQLINDLKTGWLQKTAGDAGQFSNSNLQARIAKAFETRGKEGAEALFTTTEKAQILQAVKQNKLQEVAQRMVNGASNTGSLPFVGGVFHGVPGAVAGMATKAGAEMLKKNMVANTQRKMFNAIGALPERSAPITPAASIGMPRNPNMSLPIGVGYVGGQTGGLLQ